MPYNDFSEMCHVVGDASLGFRELALLKSFFFALYVIISALHIYASFLFFSHSHRAHLYTVIGECEKLIIFYSVKRDKFY